MKSTLSSLDIAAIVEELKPKIVGSWLNNIYSLGNQLFILRFRKAGEDSIEILIELGRRFHSTKYVRNKPDAPSNKVSTMRQHIRDLPVEAFYQRGMDRVIVFEIAYKGGRYKLVFEIFGQGNFVLVSPENKIITAKFYRSMRDRDIHPGKKFEFPPLPEYNIKELTEDLYYEKINSFDNKVVYLLNTLMGLGPMYSKDILKKAGVENIKASELNEEQKKHILVELFKLKDIVLTSNYNSVKYLDQGDIVEIAPIPLEKYADLETEQVDSINDALDNYFSKHEEKPTQTSVKSKVAGKIEKLKKNLSDQKKHLERLKEQEKSYQKLGDLLYLHFTKVDELINTIMGANKAGVTWEDIVEKLEYGKEQNIPAAEVYHKIVPDSKKLFVELEDQTGDPFIIELDFTRSLADNANDYYTKSKKSRRKIPGAEQAIEKTKQIIDELKNQEVEVVDEIEKKKLVEKRPKYWYEKFHWIICNNHVIIGGKDAKSNERILRTYLEDEDLFLHADIHGAPYVVIKKGQEDLPEDCLRNAAIFALNYSSLWKAGTLVGDVYYVYPDQVSLTAPSGQYLAKGSVMIYGTKNYLNNIEIEHYIGVVLEENYAQVLGGPKAIVTNQADMWVEIKPGRIPKGSIAKIIHEKMLKLCPKEEKYKIDALTINDYLPFIPGDSRLDE